MNETHRTPSHPAARRPSAARRLLHALLDAQVRVAGPFWDGGRPGGGAAERLERAGRTAR